MLIFGILLFRSALARSCPGKTLWCLPPALILAGIYSESAYYNIIGFFKRRRYGKAYEVIIWGGVISFIALGLAGSILGFVINQIGASFLNISVPVLNYLLYAIFLIGLHGFMLVLSALGAFVHPVRLTFVEFYNNAGYKGTLHAYKPFALKQE